MDNKTETINTLKRKIHHSTGVPFYELQVRNLENGRIFLKERKLRLDSPINVDTEIKSTKLEVVIHFSPASAQMIFGSEPATPMIFDANTNMTVLDFKHFIIEEKGLNFEYFFYIKTLSPC